MNFVRLDFTRAVVEIEFTKGSFSCIINSILFYLGAKRELSFLWLATGVEEFWK